jgi:adenylate cyclase
VSNETGMSRFEWEKEIPVAEAEKLLLLCEKEYWQNSLWSKNRNLYEVDEFYGEIKAIIAEIELQSESENFENQTG